MEFVDVFQFLNYLLEEMSRLTCSLHSPQVAGVWSLTFFSTGNFYLSAISPGWGATVSNRKYGTGFTLNVGFLTRQIYTQKCVGLRGEIL